MVLALGFDEAKRNRIRIEGNGSDIERGLLLTQFFGGRDKPALPFAALVEIDAGGVSHTHFHVVDQFQVVVGGKGRLGRHDLAPYRVHFSRAYTPYGPLVSDADSGLTFFVLRARPDPGSQRLPAKQDVLKQVPGRQPWQITRAAFFGVPDSMSQNSDAMLHALPGMEDEHGLAAYTMIMKPHTKAWAPRADAGDGQYWVVVKGSLLHADVEHRSLALLFTRPDETPVEMQAGPAGLEALVLNLPRPRTAHAKTPTAHTSADFKIWQCTLCAFVYDEAAGLPEEGIPPGTRWQDVSEKWTCADCGASKADFQMLEC